MEKFNVICDHQGDKPYVVGDTRTANRQDVAHLIGSVLADPNAKTADETTSEEGANADTKADGPDANKDQGDAPANKDQGSADANKADKQPAKKSEKAAKK